MAVVDQEDRLSVLEVRTRVLPCTIISEVFTNSWCCSITTDVMFISGVVLNTLQLALIDLQPSLV